MNTAVGIIGVTEGHWASIMAILASGIFGPSIWETRVGPFNLREVWCHANNCEILLFPHPARTFLSFPIGPSEGHCRMRCGNRPCMRMDGDHHWVGWYLLWMLGLDQPRPLVAVASRWVLPSCSSGLASWPSTTLRVWRKTPSTREPPLGS
jgi:hypothetical protein